MTNLRETSRRSHVPFMMAMLLMLAVLIFTTTGCVDNPTEAEDFEPLPVLYSFIQNDATVDTVTLEWTAAYNVYYDRSLLGIQDAEIIMYPLSDENGEEIDTVANPELVLRFVPASDRESYGEYVPVDDSYYPQCLWTYRMEARKPDEGVNLWAETTVPDTFSYYAAEKSDPFTSVVVDGDTLTREDDEIYINWTESATARGFILGIIAETPRDELIPLDPEWDSNDPDDELEDYERGRHNWTIARYDQRSMTIAWIFFQWSGWNQMYINAASTSYYEYMLSLGQMGDPSWKQNPTFNVNGGIGVFGAYSTHEFRIMLERVGTGL